MFVLIKIFRIPEDNPVCWQYSLTDAEVMQVLSGRYRSTPNANYKRKAKKKRRHPDSVVKRRPVDDIW